MNSLESTESKEIKNHCHGCLGTYPLDKHDFVKCCSVDLDWDLEQMFPTESFKEITTIQKKGLLRNTIDKFYTRNIVVLSCVASIVNNISIDPDKDLIIEPSAGNGSFIQAINSLSKKCLFYDLEPDHPEVIKQDFLKIDYTILKKSNNSQNKKIHVIGNPPFGRQSSTAIQFIKMCCRFAYSISLILPRSFKKESMRKHFSLNYHLLFEVDVIKNAFTINDAEVDVPCVFQIWQYKTSERIKIKKLEPYKFKFVDKSSISPDISFRRVGVNAGTISKDIDIKSKQSHYFIKFSNGKDTDTNIALLKNITFSDNNTVGPKSISKQELISEFNKYIVLTDEINSC
jgi:predicted RNA methylase